MRKRERPELRSAAGDYLRAVARLEARDEVTRWWIGGMLGVRPVETSASSAPAPHAAAGDAIEAVDAGAYGAPPAPRRIGGAAPPAPPIEASARNVEVTQVERGTPDRPSWLSADESVIEVAAPAGPAPAPEALLAPSRTRAILSAAAATLGEGELDVEGIVERIARAEAMALAPTRTVPTLSRGLQLLVDRSEAMLPFAGDATRLQADMTRVVGAGRLEVMSFVACPMRECGRGPRLRWEAYAARHLPRRGGRVLCITDVGIGPAATGDAAADAAEWLRFRELVEGAGCTLAALVPYPASRWPRALARRIELIYWDRGTTAAGVARRLHRRRRTT